MPRRGQGWNIYVYIYIYIYIYVFSRYVLNSRPVRSVAILAESVSSGFPWPCCMARPCNIGPKPGICPAEFNKTLLKYVDSTADPDVFELRQYANMKSTSGLNMHILAFLAPFILMLLSVAPTGYMKKLDVRQAVEYCLSHRPLRKIQPEVPKKELIAIMEKQAFGDLGFRKVILF